MLVPSYARDGDPVIAAVMDRGVIVPAPVAVAGML